MTWFKRTHTRNLFDYCSSRDKSGLVLFSRFQHNFQSNPTWLAA